MGVNLNTVGDLKAALANLPDDLVIETYGYSESRAVTIMHVVPRAEEAADGCYEVLCFCGDTLATHRYLRSPPFDSNPLREIAP
jgi:hypothetical protein